MTFKNTNEASTNPAQGTPLLLSLSFLKTVHTSSKRAFRTAIAKKKKKVEKGKAQFRTHVGQIDIGLS